MIRVEALTVEGAKLLVADVFRDGRGAFDVLWDDEWPVETGVAFRPSSACFSYNESSGTLRGMHFQKSPHEQTKLVSCVNGRAWDVIVDLRRKSKTFGEWSATELSAASGRTLLVPAGCAHGFVTLDEDTTIAYLIEGPYRHEAAGVLRWDDETVGIHWPCKIRTLSEKDASAPSWVSCEF